MSAEWKGHLLNTRTDVFIDMTILLLNACAYIPQIGRLRNSTSMRGVSPYYILFNVFVSNAQLSQLLLMAAFAWPNPVRPVLERISDGSLKGLAALGAILGLLQIFVQWSCSIIVLLLFAASPQVANVRVRYISITAFLHAVAVLLPVVTTALPTPSRGHTFGNDILTALIQISNRIVAPCFIVLQFFAQLREMAKQNGNPGALSLLSIGLQVPTTAVLGYRWLLRLGHPTWTPLPASISLWYEWGFPAINYVAHAMGCALLLACYLLAARGTADHGGSREQLPLFV